MVDFDNETTIAQPPRQIITIELVETRYNFLDALEYYQKHRGSNDDVDLTIERMVVLTRLNHLFYLLKDPLERDLSQDDYKTLRAILKLKDVEDIEEAYFIISKWLYNKSFIKLDSASKYDMTDTEADNDAHGFS